MFLAHAVVACASHLFTVTMTCQYTDACLMPLLIHVMEVIALMIVGMGDVIASTMSWQPGKVPFAMRL